MPAGKPSFCWLHVYQVKVKLSKRSDSRAADALFVSKYNSKSILSGCHLCLSGALPPFFLLPSFPLSPPSLSLSVSYLSELTLISADRHTQALKENGLKNQKAWLYHPEDFFPFFFFAIIFTFFHSPGFIHLSVHPFSPPLHHPHPLWLHPLIYSYVVLLLLFFHLPCKEK